MVSVVSWSWFRWSWLQV